MAGAAGRPNRPHRLRCDRAAGAGHGEAPGPSAHAKEPEALDSDNGLVELGGIEPPRPTLSLHAFSGRSLCRRSARLRPLSQTPKSTSPAWEESHVTSRRRHAARFLDDARIRIGITYGLTDYRARLGSEGEVSALCIGTYCFAGSVHEITLHPRPASRGFTGAVETDQPWTSREGAVVALLSFQRAPQRPSITDYNGSGRSAIPGRSRHGAPGCFAEAPLVSSDRRAA